jgi:hypothetical protein
VSDETDRLKDGYWVDVFAFGNDHEMDVEQRDCERGAAALFGLGVILRCRESWNS